MSTQASCSSVCESQARYSYYSHATSRLRGCTTLRCSQRQSLRLLPRAVAASRDPALAVEPPSSRQPSPSGQLQSPRWRSPLTALSLQGPSTEPAVAAIAMVYAVQGLSEVSVLAQKYFLKDELGASAAEVAILMSLANIPWMMKPLMGFLSDSVPLWGYRRRSYLLLASAAAACSWMFLAESGASAGLQGMLAAVLVASAAGALSDVVVDSMAVERARGEHQDAAGTFQSLCWAAFAVGQIATAAVGGTLLQEHGPRFVFGLTAAFPALIALSAMMLREEPVLRAARVPRQEQALDGSGDAGWSSPAGVGKVAAHLEAEAGHSAKLLQQQCSSDGASSARTSAAATGSGRQLVIADATEALIDERPATSRAAVCGGAAAEVLRGAEGQQQQLSAPAQPVLASSELATAGAAAQAQALWRTLSTPAIAGPVTFLFLLSATPSADNAMFYFQTQELGFSASFLGQIQLGVALASLAGVWLYQSCFRVVPLQRLLLWGTLLGASLQCSDLLLATHANRALGLDDHLFVIGGSVVTSVITNVLAMPTLVLAARLCPKGLEATTFAAIMSLLNMADGIRYGAGAALMQALGVGAVSTAATSSDSGGFANLPVLLMICNASLLLPLPLLAWLPNEAAPEFDKPEDGTSISGYSDDVMAAAPQELFVALPSLACQAVDSAGQHHHTPGAHGRLGSAHHAGSVGADVMTQNGKNGANNIQPLPRQWPAGGRKARQRRHSPLSSASS